MESYTCAECGSRFERPPTRGQRPRYCPACRKGAKGGSRFGPWRECQECGERFRRTRSSENQAALKSVCRACRAIYPRAVKYPERPSVPRRVLLWVAGACAHCSETFVVASTGGSEGRYCSDACAQRERETRRRLRGWRPYRESAISWRSLMAEGLSTCYLCGDPVDPDDFEVVDGHFRAGITYPSLDHVVPLALGGEHSRSNSALAHLLCNSLKGATL